MTLKNGSMCEVVKREWKFIDTDAATTHFVGLLRHASVIEATLTGPLPIQLLQALSSADLDVTVGRLAIYSFALKPMHVPVARSALTSFSSLRRLTLWDDVVLELLTDDLLVILKQIGVVKHEFRSEVFCVRVIGDDWAGRQVLVNTYDGDFPTLDGGLMAFPFRGRELEHEEVTLNFPAARVPPDFCQRLLEAAVFDGSRSKVDLSFVAVVDDLVVELEGFQEHASELNRNTIVYKVPQSPASDMLLELKITTLGDAPHNWKLVEFRRDKKPSPRTAGGGWGEGEWGGFGGGGFGYGGGWGGGGWA